MAPGDSFLRTHGATLEPQGVGRWQLSYQVESFDYGESGFHPAWTSRFRSRPATRDDALLLCAVILRGHKAPEPKQIRVGRWKLIYPKYSMGLWEKGATTLEQAQMHMIDDMIEKLSIQDGDNILDFGCGWGCVPNYIMARFPNVRFTGLNLSHEQCEYMRRKMQDPESHLSSGRFTLVEVDLNDVHFKDKFDKILSVGVFCHVGNLTDSFRRMACFLKPGGSFFLHIITVRLPNNISSAFTHKYIFPHGRYWNFDAVSSHNKDLKMVREMVPKRHELFYHRSDLVEKL